MIGQVEDVRQALDDVYEALADALTASPPEAPEKHGVLDWLRTMPSSSHLPQRWQGGSVASKFAPPSLIEVGAVPTSASATRPDAGKPKPPERPDSAESSRCSWSRGPPN
jgi:hypothetical protein